MQRQTLNKQIIIICVYQCLKKVSIANKSISKQLLILPIKTKPYFILIIVFYGIVFAIS